MKKVTQKGKVLALVGALHLKIAEILRKKGKKVNDFIIVGGKSSFKVSKKIKNRFLISHRDLKKFNVPKTIITEKTKGIYIP